MASVQYGRFAEFLKDFLTNDSFRFSVLFRERSELLAYGLSTAQIDAIQSLKRQDIIDELAKDLLRWGADIDKLFTQVKGPFPPPATDRALPLAEAAAYAEDKIFILTVIPPGPNSWINIGEQTPITLLGLGFDRKMVQVRFKHQDSGDELYGDFTNAACAHDLYQHIGVTTPELTVGFWDIHARNSTDVASNLTFEDATMRKGTIEVR